MLPEPADQLVRWNGLAELEALYEVAVEPGDLVENGGGLDTLGHDLQAEVLAQVDDRLDDCPVVVVVENACDERPIDLDLVEGQLGEVGERGVRRRSRRRPA